MRPARVTAGSTQLVGPSTDIDRFGCTETRPRPFRPARKAGGILSLGAALVIGLGGACRAVESDVTLMLDRAQVMHYPAATETVVVGNPIIADVTMLRNSGEVILTGKGFGDTNLLFIDGGGNVLSETRLRVREPSAMMVVQRGAGRETYACQPRCQPTVTLGDDYDYMQNSAKSVRLRNGLALGAAAPAAPGQ